MSSLREVKDRIASVRSTLKITSAMKLVASSKLRKAQRSIEALRPYERALEEILCAVQGCGFVLQEPNKLGERAPEAHTHSPEAAVSEAGSPCPPDPFTPIFWGTEDTENRRTIVLLAFSSNSSMCGAFNANAIKKAFEVASELESRGVEVEVWSFGKKMTDAFRKRGTPAARDYSTLVAHPDYKLSAEAASELRARYDSGEIAGATLVYNHFVSAGRQQVVTEQYLSASELPLQDAAEVQADYILEPSRPALLEALAPQVGDLKLYSALLDSVAAEHAARMVAMQAATDNGEQLLAELTLEYNKGRQQKITSEILDLVGGSAV
ncbi:MAG: F0F1 ATP synthase subunit gamma [Bacteroidales bacterium]|nr:F0F1 ATP synthase subunit gamma [Bacteroidales bacterium]